MEIDATSWRSPNFNERGCAVDMLVLHYTGMKTAQIALARMCDAAAEVSAHYCIDVDGAVFQLVDENMRAWHAGIGSWRGHVDINSRSIGIELVNPGHEFGYCDFAPKQMQACVELCHKIVERHGILPQNVVAHSDIAPMRKQDPGERFDWRQLADAGVGWWFDALADDAILLQAGDSSAAVERLQRDLREYGYGLEVDGEFGEQTQAVAVAFGRHFVQKHCDGTWNAALNDVLQQLL